MTKHRSGALKGSLFEEMINETNELYREQELALVQKIPTPIIPMRQDRKRHVITLAFFEQKSTVDYIGVACGSPVCFDAKECIYKSYPLRNIPQHQIRYMDDFQKQGGVAFLLICRKENEGDTFYYVPFRFIQAFLHRAQNGGRKSISFDELDPKWAFTKTDQFPVPYLDMIALDLSGGITEHCNKRTSEKRKDGS